MNNYQNYLNNPTFTHYPYLKKYPGWHYFGAEPGFTLISTLFQSFKSSIKKSILYNYYSEEYFWEEVRRAEDGEMIEEGVVEYDDVFNYLLFNLQNSTQNIIIMDKLTGAILFEIPLTPENLAKKFEDIITTENLAKKLEDTFPRNFSNPLEEVEIYAQ